MSSEQRRALRIALSFTASFVAAELIRRDLQLTFLAPLVASSLAYGQKPSARVLVAIPIVAWLLVAAAGIALQFLSREPIVLALLQLWVFWLGFTLMRQPATQTLGLITLLVFAIVPQALIKGPELSADLAWWFALNFALAAVSEWLTRRVLPGSAPPVSAAPPLMSPLATAACLLLAVVLTAAMQLPAPGAIIVGIIIVLRADGGGASHVIMDRLVAALLGGVMAVAVWEVIWVAPSLPVLATTVLFAAWLFASRIAAGGPDVGIATKSLNVLAVLVGEGFSVFYEDSDDRIWTRIAGVVIGLLYVALIVSIVRRRAFRRRLMLAGKLRRA